MAEFVKQPRDENGHTVPLRDFIERVFEEKEKALQLAFRSQQEALGLASRTLELRLEKLNELRQEVTTDRGRYLTQDKYQADLAAIKEWQNRMDGALGIVRVISIGGGLALFIQVARLLRWIE